MLVGILVGVLVILTITTLVTWKMRASACGRRIEVPAGERQRIFYGGVLCRAITTGGPLVRLELMDWGVRLQGTIWSRWIVPTWEARYDELAIAELVATAFSRTAVWFRLRGSAEGIGFLSTVSDDIIREMEKHDVPVNRSVGQFKRVAELYRAP